ncbi:phage-related protein [Paenibacillus larvae subsp. larvae DSM 25430]|uniref:Phage-related protein n=2 Tax=Paenibacillus larvae TaxID=1464 RepID=V9W9Q0_9BACL|nr:phage-related protein [Paenibacillus larvae subsp. larvae DSM 25430]AVG12978.1 phage-related protein [Paenibacillus larvae subsp. larvae DSM 25430]
MKRMDEINIGSALMTLFPDAEPAIDYTVVRDEDGKQRIVEWHLDAPIPTKEELRERYKKYLEEQAKKPRSISTIRELRLEKDLAIMELTQALTGDVRDAFTKDSSVVASWLRLIKQEIVTVEDVPDFYNLREVVSKFIEEEGLWSV